jgi:hypothetical protein
MVGSAKADDKDTQPPVNQPGRDIAVRVQLAGCMMKTLVSGLLKLMYPQQRLGHGCQCILAIGNQLVRQQGKSAPGGFAQQACDWNLFFLERKKLNRKPVIFFNLTIASLFAAKRTLGSNETVKINPLLKKGILVFPDIAVCVRKRKLYIIKEGDQHLAVRVSFFLSG